MEELTKFTNTTFENLESSAESGNSDATDNESSCTRYVQEVVEPPLRYMHDIRKFGEDGKKDLPVIMKKGRTQLDEYDVAEKKIRKIEYSNASSAYSPLVLQRESSAVSQEKFLPGN